MLPNIKKLTEGRWPAILGALGIEERYLRNKHGPCPLCGDGVDRYRFDDRGQGMWICSHCGAGDGLKLVMNMKGVDFKEAAKLVLDVLPSAPQTTVAKERSADEKRQALRSMWKRLREITKDDPVFRYLRGRGIEDIPDALRYGRLPYYDDGKKSGEYDAMAAVISGPDGKGVSLHVTYLQDGKRAPVEPARKVMQSVSTIAGGAVRLFRTAGVLGIAEGIETAISASELFKVPVWAAVSAHGMETFVWPPDTKLLIICADNDESYTGHKAAYTLAQRAKVRGLDVDIRMPDGPGEDWNDVLRRMRA